MTNTKKPTKRDYYNALLSKYPLTDDEKAFINHEIELLDKKNSTEKKPSATAVANDKLKATILAEMTVNKAYTCSDIIKTVGECSELSTPKVSYLMNALADEHKVVKTTDKKKTYFTKTAEVEGAVLLADEVEG
jgi:hypothetical protein